MFDPEFFPTPREVIRKMIEPYIEFHVPGRPYMRFKRSLFGDSPEILDPSAGKGDILDVLTDLRTEDRFGNKTHWHGDSGVTKDRSCYAIEPNPDLQQILQGKGYRVIDTDFLSHRPAYSYDLIIMNPPFSTGDQHLLKAWDILESGHIVCLLNAETIRNPYTRNRELLARIIEESGEVEFIGQAFAKAERPTDVDVAIVRLHKKADRNRFEFNFTPVEDSDKLNIGEEDVRDDGEVAINDFLGALLRTYRQTTEAYLAYVEAKGRLAFYSSHVIDMSVSHKGIDSILEHVKGESVKERYNSFVTAIKKEAWVEIIRKMNIEKYMTARVLKDWEEWKKRQGLLDMNRQNIHSLMMNLVNNRDEIMKKACIDVFDIMTQYHEENRCYIEGWKTNSMWKVNRKVILPNYVSNASNGGYELSHYRWDEYRDIDKVMSHLSGKKYEEVRRIEDVFRNRPKEKAGESEFFMLKWYKKGTLHLLFKDEDLWARFNQVVCDGKNWLGGKVA